MTAPLLRVDEESRGKNDIDRQQLHAFQPCAFPVGNEQVGESDRDNHHHHLKCIEQEIQRMTGK